MNIFMILIKELQAISKPAINERLQELTTKKTEVSSELPK
jgi:hypothetical protein